jgi:hypothetical protein
VTDNRQLFKVEVSTTYFAWSTSAPAAINDFIWDAIKDSCNWGWDAHSEELNEPPVGWSVDTLVYAKGIDKDLTIGDCLSAQQQQTQTNEESP